MKIPFNLLFPEGECNKPIKKLVKSGKVRQRRDNELIGYCGGKLIGVVVRYGKKYYDQVTAVQVCCSKCGHVKSITNVDYKYVKPPNVKWKKRRKRNNGTGTKVQRND